MSLLDDVYQQLSAYNGNNYDLLSNDVRTRLNNVDDQLRAGPSSLRNHGRIIRVSHYTDKIVFHTPSDVVIGQSTVEFEFPKAVLAAEDPVYAAKLYIADQQIRFAQATVTDAETKLRVAKAIHNWYVVQKEQMVKSYKEQANV